nr:phosphoinositide phosphatase SAC6-like [Ipomoea batatas]
MVLLPKTPTLERVKVSSILGPTKFPALKGNRMDKSMTGDMDNLPEEDKIRMPAMRFSMIGQKMLEFQLRRLGVFNAEETISKHPNLDENFKICKVEIQSYALVMNSSIEVLYTLRISGFGS